MEQILYAYQFAREGQLFINLLGELIKYEQGELRTRIAPSHYALSVTEQFGQNNPYQGSLNQLMPTTGKLHRPRVGDVLFGPQGFQYTFLNTTPTQGLSTYCRKFYDDCVSRSHTELVHEMQLRMLSSTPPEFVWFRAGDKVTDAAGRVFEVLSRPIQGVDFPCADVKLLQDSDSYPFLVGIGQVVRIGLSLLVGMKLVGGLEDRLPKYPVGHYVYKESVGVVYVAGWTYDAAQPYLVFEDFSRHFTDLDDSWEVLPKLRPGTLLELNMEYWDECPDEWLDRESKLLISNVEVYPYGIGVKVYSDGEYYEVPVRCLDLDVWRAIDDSDARPAAQVVRLESGDWGPALRVDRLGTYVLTANGLKIGKAVEVLGRPGELFAGRGKTWVMEVDCKSLFCLEDSESVDFDPTEFIKL